MTQLTQEVPESALTTLPKSHQEFAHKLHMAAVGYERLSCSRTVA